MHQYFGHESDTEHLIIDGAAVRAHPCAAEASKKQVTKRPKLLMEAGVGSALKFI